VFKSEERKKTSTVEINVGMPDSQSYFLTIPKEREYRPKKPKSRKSEISADDDFYQAMVKDMFDKLEEEFNIERHCSLIGLSKN